MNYNIIFFVHRKEVYRKLEVELHLFFNSTLDGGELPALHPNRFVPGKYPSIHLIGLNWLITLKGWVWGGGEQNRPWVLGNLIYKTVKLGRLERSMWKPVFSFFTSFHHPNNRLKIPLFFAPLHINSKKKKKERNYCSVQKYGTDI